MNLGNGQRKKVDDRGVKSAVGGMFVARAFNFKPIVAVVHIEESAVGGDRVRLFLLLRFL